MEEEKAGSGDLWAEGFDESLDISGMYGIKRILSDTSSSSIIPRSSYYNHD